MTVKLLLLKSGEDVISDVNEMVVGEEENQRVVGYFLHKPCVVKMTPPTNAPNNVPEKNENSYGEQTASFQVTLFPWMPLTKDKVIPISTDWVITMVNPTDKIKDMYMEEVLNYGKDNQGDSVNEQSDSDKSD